MNKREAYELGAKIRRKLEAQAIISAHALGAEVELTPEIVSLATEDAPVTKLPSGELWRSGVHVEKDTIVSYGNLSYVCIKSHLTQSNWSPDRTLGHLWDVHNAEAGTTDNPIPFTLGMGVQKGLYYSYNGKVWTWEVADMPSCSWNPGTAGVWQWKEVG